MSVKVVDEILVTLKNRWFSFVYSVKTKTRKIFWPFALNCLHRGQHFINEKFSRNLKTSWRKSPVKVGKKKSPHCKPSTAVAHNSKTNTRRTFRFAAFDSARIGQHFINATLWSKTRTWRWKSALKNGGADWNCGLINNTINKGQIQNAEIHWIDVLINTANWQVTWRFQRSTFWFLWHFINYFH